MSQQRHHAGSGTRMLLCVGPEGTGKTLLLRRLANLTKPDLNLTTVPTVGMNIATIPQAPELPPVTIRELGEDSIKTT